MCATVATVKRTVALLAMAALACGGQVVPGNGDAGADGAPDGAGYTDCTSPSGYAVCGGPNQCDFHNCISACSYAIPPSDFGFCLGSGLPDPLNGKVCEPGYGGDVCILIPIINSTTGWADAPFEMGPLFASNGAADRVRYADLSLWTGDPVPDPQSCPDLGGTPACGGACGACPAGFTCRGRSPLHPVGFCSDDSANWGANCGAPPSVYHGACPKSQGCFTYLVQPEVQKDADDAGMCLPIDQCNALAAAMPGGAKCTPP